MKVTKFSRCLITLLCLAAAAGIHASAQLMDMSMNSGVIAWHAEPWPTVGLTGFRLWDSDTYWYLLNPSDGVYDWSVLDGWLAASQQHNQQILYTLGYTPQWASSNPNDQTCIGGPGVCDPPNDLNADGTGTNQHWKDYVTAVAQHSKDSNTGHITAWEIWDEPFGSWEWNGTVPQMVRMAKDAHSIIKGIDPNAIILTPSFYSNWGLSYNWMAKYFALGAGNYADAIAVHGYLLPGGHHGDPELLVPAIQRFRSALTTYGQEKKPIWDTEASWGNSYRTHFTDSDLQAGWLARFYLLHKFNSISRMYWYSWNSTKGDGTLWIPNPKDQRLPGTVLKPGVAYGQVENWLQGTQVSSQCSSQGQSIWTCGLTGSAGYQGLLIWDTSKTCSQGQCQTAKYIVGNQYLHYRTLDGNALPVTNHTVFVGYKPILAENR